NGLLKWTYQPNEGYENLAQLYKGVSEQYEFYVGHVLTNIGGIYETPKTTEQEGPVFETVPVTRQREAMEFLARQVLTTPRWMLDTAILTRIGESPTQTITGIHNMVMNHLLSPATLSKLAVAEAVYGPKAYQLVDYFSDIDNALWSELKSGSTIDIYRRNLQRTYVDKLLELSAKPGKDYRDVGPIMKMKLAEIAVNIGRALPKVKDQMTTYHLKYIQGKLASAAERL
ncbi:MAG TPA: zinc-dependent metalloprotease, partial [Chryseosolibacter sp.]|nr:zinc-dependent metalloprotease [Chryseosolibacter sp.]